MSQQHQHQHQHRLKIGYALTPKKSETFILPSLITHANQHNIDLIPIDPSKPLLPQSPFHCIIHKIHTPFWTNQLHQFSLKYPSVPIIDPPHQIQKLHNRVSMLDSVTLLENKQKGSFGIPKQVVLYEENGLSGLEGVLKFPVVAKPLEADGSESSHEMFLILNGVGFRKLSFPVVLQEFVDHGGFVFKVYVVGESVKCVARKSLPDIQDFRDGEFGEVEEGAISFSRVSNLVGEGKENNVVMPPLEFVESLARGLRGELGLSLFNFDLIRDSADSNRYLVIDINYFPGYAKMPNFEEVLVEFFRDVASKGGELGGDGTESEVGVAGYDERDVS